MRPRHVRSGGPRIGWRDILAHWDLVVPDLAERYGVRVWVDDISWPELRDLIVGLVAVPSRLAEALAPRVRGGQRQ